MPIITAECKAFADNYEKNQETMKQDLDHLRKWLKTQKHLPEVKDSLLMHFFHSCFYNIANTKECIESYFVLRSNSPDIFTGRDITHPSLSKALESVYLFVLPEPDPNGYLIVYNALRDTDPAKFKYMEANKLVLMSIDAYLEKHEPHPGTVLLINMEGTKLGHLAKLSLSVARRSLQYQQEGNPIRLKAIHFINVVSWIDKAMALLKPFIKKELLELVHFHTNGSESVYEYIPQKCLPKDLGGAQKSMDELQGQTIEFMGSMSEFFLEQEKLTVDESQREKKGKKSSVKPVDIMFETLDID